MERKGTEKEVLNFEIKHSAYCAWLKPIQGASADKAHLEVTFVQQVQSRSCLAFPQPSDDGFNVKLMQDRVRIAKPRMNIIDT